jgi:hypothetical protein
MSTGMSSDPVIARESGRCQRKPFLKLWVWERTKGAEPRESPLRQADAAIYLRHRALFAR